MQRLIRESSVDVRSLNLWLALIAEFTGTFVITLFGCGAWVSNPTNVNVVQAALTFGLSVGSVVWLFGHVSGGHFNPAVTAAYLLTRKISVIRGVLYVLIQMAGAIAGAGLLNQLLPWGFARTRGTNVLAVGVNSAQGFGVECLATFIYVLAMAASSDAKRSETKAITALNICIAVIVGQLFAIPFTRGGMNPARSFGPAVVTNIWTNHWVFWVGPLAGAILAGLLYEYVLSAGATFSGAKKYLLKIREAKRSGHIGEAKEQPLEVIEAGESNVEGQNDAGKDA